LHDLLHQRADFAGLVAACAVADAVEAGQGALLRCAIRLGHACPGLDELGGPLCRSPPEDDQVEEAVGTETVAAVYRDARRFADRHQSGDDRLAPVFRRIDHLSPDIGRNATHDVVHGGNDWDRLLVGIYARKGAGALHDAR